MNNQTAFGIRKQSSQKHTPLDDENEETFDNVFDNEEEMCYIGGTRRIDFALENNNLRNESDGFEEEGEENEENGGLYEDSDDGDEDLFHNGSYIVNGYVTRRASTFYQCI